MQSQPVSKQADLNNEDEAYRTLQRLERQASEEARRQRAHERVQIKAKVVIQPGNSSQIGGLKAQGITGDISAGGCRAMIPLPVQAGDIYRLQFDGVELGEPSLFARCLRCRFISEDAFEAGLQFLQPVSLPAEVEAGSRQGVGAA